MVLFYLPIVVSPTFYFLIFSNISVSFLILFYFLLFVIVLLLFFFFFFFFFCHPTWLVGSWFMSQGSGLSSCGGSCKSESLD